jgi:hypothetical protein
MLLRVLKTYDLPELCMIAIATSFVVISVAYFLP